MSSFNDYVELRQAQIKRKQRLIGIVSAGLFLGSTAFTAGRFLISGFVQNTQTQSSDIKTVQAQSGAEEQGYELVLQREPNNQVALESLARIRIQTRNLQGAQETLETLVKLNPNHTDYRILLAQVKKQAQAIK